MTLEGAIALALAFTPGLILRAGMSGAVVGLDYRGALALAPRECDRDALIVYLRRAEAGMLDGFRKTEKQNGGE